MEENSIKYGVETSSDEVEHAYTYIEQDSKPKDYDSIPHGIDFDVLAFGGASTVCATTPLEEKRSDTYQSEAALEDAFIKQLQRQAYEYLDIHTQDDLIANLRIQIQKLNDITFKDSEWKRFFKTAVASDNASIKEKTRIIQDDSTQAFRRDDGTTKNIKLIDKKNIHNNSLQVINQYEAPGGKYENRYDVTILVNGLPLVHVELKRRGVPIREAFNQIERYQQESFWSECGLYEYIQIFVISNGTQTKYYSNTTRLCHIEEGKKKKGSAKKTSNSFKFSSWWADAENKPIYDLVPFTATFFAKHTILNILTKYCIFDTEEKLLVMRPYQIVACERILNKILISENDKKMLGTLKAGGYIWHTTGSGKTLTSFKTARLACEMEGIDKVFFVVDRKDLDYQTMKEYDRFEKGAANGSKSTKVLTRQIEDKDKNGSPHTYKILVTTIQKLSVFIKKNPKHAIYNKHVVLIFDECHRGQFGDMHEAITKHFKNYHIFGFTGTPIFSQNSTSGTKANMRTTKKTFGERLHTYTIVDAIRDDNVLPFRIDYINTIKERNDYDDEQVYGIQRKTPYKTFERVNKICKYIIDNFDAKTKRNDAYTLGDKRKMGFNSILCVDSIDSAKVYYSAFKRIQAQNTKERLRIGLIYSFTENEDTQGCGLPDESFDVESLDTSSRDFLDDAIDDYNAMYHTNFDTSSEGFQNYYKDLSDKIKKRDIDLVIVVNMFLTGFDATTLNTLWVDKDLRMHGLIQAFSRTNRILNSVKTFGNIVCFRNLQDKVNEAIALFGNKDAKGIVLLKPYEEYLQQYTESIASLRGMVSPGEFPYGETEEKEFIKLFGQILRLKNILSCFDEFKADDILSDRDQQDYRSVYVDLYDKYRKERKEATNIVDDLEFEIELIKQVDITIDYILMLVKKYSDTNCQDKEIIADIKRKVAGSPELHNKKDLIEKFIEEINAAEDVDESWKEYISRAYEGELSKIIESEKLKTEETHTFLKEVLKDGEVPETGTAITKLMKVKPSRFAPSDEYASKKQRILEKLKSFFERFKGLKVQKREK